MFKWQKITPLIETGKALQMPLSMEDHHDITVFSNKRYVRLKIRPIY